MRDKMWNLNILTGIWYISAPVICYYAGYCAGYVLIGSVFAGKTAAGSAGFNGIYMLSGLLFLLLFLLPGKRKERKLCGRKEEKKEKMPRFYWMLIAVLAFFASLMGNELIRFLKPFLASGDAEEAMKSLFSVTFMTGVITYGIIAPAAEEILFRYLLADRIRTILEERKKREIMPEKGGWGAAWYRKTGLTAEVWQAALLSSLLFGIYHGNPEQGIYAFLMGMLLALMYYLFQNIAAAMLFHMTANMTVYLLSGDRMLYRFLTRPAVLFLMAVLSAGILYIFFRQNSLAEKNRKKNTTYSA